MRLEVDRWKLDRRKLRGQGGSSTGGSSTGGVAGSSGSSGSATGGAGTGGGAEIERAGLLEVEFVLASATGTPAYTSVGGRIYDGLVPPDRYWNVAGEASGAPSTHRGRFSAIRRAAQGRNVCPLRVPTPDAHFSPARTTPERSL